jgi:hypothetical protein
MYQVVAGTGPCLLLGKGKRCHSWALATTTATAGIINIRDGSASGPIMARVNLAGNASASQAAKGPPHLLLAPAGFVVEIVQGVIVGSLDLE